MYALYLKNAQGCVLQCRHCFVTVVHMQQIHWAYISFRIISQDAGSEFKWKMEKGIFFFEF